MKRLVRFALALAPLGFGLLSAIPSGRAAVVIPPRFVNPDTTLLRDTLDIDFERIFVLADSLRCTPDTLRALAVRYAFPLEHLVFLADSLHLHDVDQLGARIEESRNLILASAGQQGTTFVYSSGYTTQQGSTLWNNQLQYTWVQGPRVVKNTTTVSLTRQLAASVLTRRQQRRSETSLGWLLSPRVSLGGRAILSGSAQLDRTIYSFADDNTDLQMSMESKHEPFPGLHAELNLYEGVRNENKGNSTRSGYLGEVNSRVRYERGDWLSWEMAGTLNGNHMRTLTNAMPFKTTDLASRGTASLALFQAARVSGRLDLTYDAPHTEQVPQVSGANTQLLVISSATKRRSAKGSMRFQRSSDTFLDLSGDVSDQQQPVNTGAGNVSYADDVSYGNDRSTTLSGNTILWGWSVNSTFTLSRDEQFTPRVKTDVPRYHERSITSSKSLDANLSRPLTPRLTARLAGSISLDSYDYSVTTTLADPVGHDKDSPRQSWRAEVTYTATENFRNTATLEVSRWQDLNLGGAFSASNTENRNYRAGWQWTARLAPGLTANQNNTINAGYFRQLFDPPENKLSIHYSAVTILNALITPHLAVDVTHNADFEPSGAYRFTSQGIEAFSPSSDTRRYVLNANLRYTASPAITLNLNPVYDFQRNSARLNGAAIPQHTSKGLTLFGGANLNLSIGSGGRLTGQIGHQFSDRVDLPASGPNPPSVEFWQGSLQFSWKL